jgi:hypothetical protein
MVAMQQPTKYMRVLIRLVFLFSVVFLLSCKKDRKNLNHKEENKISNVETIGYSKDRNCFSKDDIQILNEHFDLLKKAAISNKDFDFSNAPIKYTESQKKSILSVFKDHFCKNKSIEFKEDCIDTLLLEVFCMEEIEIDEDEEHVREEYYSYKLEKHNDIILITKIDGAG